MTPTLRRRLASALVGALASVYFGPAPGASSVLMESCMLDALRDADDATTVGELRKRCASELEAEEQLRASPRVETTPAEDGESAVDRRVALEEAAAYNPFSITPHKPNYLLPVAHNFTPNRTPFSGRDRNLDGTEVKFQFSYKVPVVRDLLGDNGTIFFAYTNQSYWQAYNGAESRQFRETNHEPEAFVSFNTDWNLLGLTNSLINVGAVHQSNGRSGSLSRSWNRLFIDFILERENFYMSLKPWYRIPEDDDDDDNPDITDFMGYGEIRALYKLRNNLFGVMLRNNLRSDNKGALQLDWSFPLTRNLRGYVQYFNGYGESLIDYDASTNRVGVGILVTDWL